jgi:hypothetical protein
LRCQCCAIRIPKRERDFIFALGCGSSSSAAAIRFEMPGRRRRSERVDDRSGRLGAPAAQGDDLPGWIGLATEFRPFPSAADASGNNYRYVTSTLCWWWARALFLKNLPECDLRHTSDRSSEILLV